MLLISRDEGEFGKSLAAHRDYSRFQETEGRRPGSIFTVWPVIHFPDGSSASFNLGYRLLLVQGDPGVIAVISDMENYGADVDIEQLLRTADF